MTRYDVPMTGEHGRLSHSAVMGHDAVEYICSLYCQNNALFTGARGAARARLVARGRPRARATGRGPTRQVTRTPLDTAGRERPRASTGREGDRPAAVTPMTPREKREAPPRAFILRTRSLGARCRAARRREQRT